jgi:hypothetical protein
MDAVAIPKYVWYSSSLHPYNVKQRKKAVNEKFRLFWNEFHSITQLPKENIAKAQREWKKLSDKEQQKP